MAVTAFADSVEQSLGSVRFNGHWTGAATGPGTPWAQFKWGYDSFNFETPITFYEGQSSGSHSAVESVDRDRDAKFRLFVQSNAGNDESTSINFRTFADDMLFGGLFPGTPTTTECAVSGSINPNTVKSSTSVNIQYRQAGTVEWIDLPTLTTLPGPQSGFTGLGGTIAGLTPATAYEARYRAIRDTSNASVAYSNIGTFTTQGATPTIVGCPLLVVEVVLFVPAAIAAGITINPPLLEIEVKLNVPSIITSQRRVIVMSVIFATGKRLNAVID